MRDNASSAEAVQGAKPSERGLFLRLRRFVRDRRGVGGIEFAIVAPLLIMAYIGAFEISVATAVSRKVSRASNTVSDLLTRSDTTNIDVLKSMKDVTKSVLAPFSQTGYSLAITGIAVDAAGKGTVAWQYGENATSLKLEGKGNTVTLPKDMDAKSTFIVRTEFSVPHTVLLMMPGLTSQLNTISLGKISYFRQRTGEAINCTGC